MKRRTGLLVAVGVVLSAAVVASLATWLRSNDSGVATTGTSSHKSVRVVIAGTNDAKEEVTDGGIVGEGVFRASGAIRDKGTARAYRGVSILNEGLILLRFVTKGEKGVITYMVRIDTTRRPVVSRWTIESATRAYKGLHGKGIETENATFTVSTLRGTVWR